VLGITGTHITAAVKPLFVKEIIFTDASAARRVKGSCSSLIPDTCLEDRQFRAQKKPLTLNTEITTLPGEQRLCMVPPELPSGRNRVGGPGRFKLEREATGLPSRSGDENTKSLLLPSDVDWVSIGLSPSDVSAAIQIHRKWDGQLFRVHVRDGRTFVLKTFPRRETEDAPTEILAYAVLSEHQVTLLPHRLSERAVLLEDLARSRRWRLANNCDVAQESVGRSLALWYRHFHSAGRYFVTAKDPRLSQLRYEWEQVTPTSVMDLAERGISGPACGWRYVAEHISAILSAIRAMPCTFNYNDFHWSNLAISRAARDRKVALFDFHLFGVGMAYSDIRNVSSALHEPARSAFLDAYGPGEERERLLDAPVATLSAVLFGLQQQAVPRWTNALLDEIRSGAFEDALRNASDVLGEGSGYTIQEPA